MSRPYILVFKHTLLKGKARKNIFTSGMPKWLMEAFMNVFLMYRVGQTQLGSRHLSTTKGTFSFSRVLLD
jgi:hypothetical protein